MDSDTPNDPKIRRLIDERARWAAIAGRDGQLDAAATMGHLFLVWCFVANHGAQPGMGVKADGRPLDLDDLAYAALFDSRDTLRVFLDDLAERGLIGKAEWQDAGIVFLPAMKARADAYAKSKGRGPAGEPGPDGPGRGSSGKSGPRRALAGPAGPIHDSTEQDTTPEEKQVGDLLADAGDDQVTILVRIWNEERKPGPTIRDITDSRRYHYQLALRVQPDLSIWRMVIRWMNTQKWMNAGGSGDHRNWRADLDWLAKPGKLQAQHERALTDRAFQRAEAGLGTSTEGRDAAKGRTGRQRGAFAGLEGGGDAGKVH